MSRDTYNYKRMAIKTAKELFYPKQTIDQLHTAKTIAEIERIMVTARKEA